MRTLFILALLALLAGVGVVALIETDPGYILVAYGRYTLETSLWVGLVLLFLLALLVYGLLNLVHRIMIGQRSLRGWFGDRHARVAGRLTTRGLINYVEGNWSKSLRQLVNGARNNDAPLINYLLAARASSRLGDADRAGEHLAAAVAAESEAGVAVALTRAELQLDREQYQQALATLEEVRGSAGRYPRTLELLSRAYRGLGDWEQLAGLLADLRKYDICSQDELARLEHEVCGRLLQVEGAQDSEKLQRRWQAMPAHLRRQPDLLQQYAQLLVRLAPEAVAEKMLQRALKQEWNSDLARIYGLLEGENNHKRLVQAESWLAEHPDDAELLLALGRMCCRDSLWGKAREYFEQSYKLERTPEVCAELGRLLAALGEPRPSGAYFREGLLLAASELPALPSPADRERAETSPRPLRAGT